MSQVMLTEREVSQVMLTERDARNCVRSLRHPLDKLRSFIDDTEGISDGLGME